MNSNKNTNINNKNTNYGRKDCKDAVWKKAKKVKELNPDEYRLCAISNDIIRYSHYGNNSSIYNWDIDHIIPKSKNGSDDISNLQAVSASKNRSIGNSIKEKPEVMTKMFEAKRIQRGILPKKHVGFKWDSSIIGKIFWVKASPTTIPQRGFIQSYDKKYVKVFWEDAKYEIILPLDKDLFEVIPEGRPKRNVL